MLLDQVVSAMDLKCGRAATKRLRWKGFGVGAIRVFMPRYGTRVPYHDRHRNRDRHRILNPWSGLISLKFFASLLPALPPFGPLNFLFFIFVQCCFLVSL